MKKNSNKRQFLSQKETTARGTERSKYLATSVPLSSRLGVESLKVYGKIQISEFLEIICRIWREEAAILKRCDTLPTPKKILSITLLGPMSNAIRKFKDSVEFLKRAHNLRVNLDSYTMIHHIEKF